MKIGRMAVKEKYKYSVNIFWLLYIKIIIGVVYYGVYVWATSLMADKLHGLLPGDLYIGKL